MLPPVLRFCPACHSIYTAHVDHCGIDGTRLVEGDEDPLVGRELDRYRVIERVGQGAMGCVYRVEHTILEREHAMKVLFGDLGADNRIVERFKREAKAVSKMRHPNILSVVDFGRTSNGLTFLVMEHAPGVTLQDQINAEAPFPPAKAARILEQIVAGLGEAHQLGFVHRDVKPSNIMIQEEDGLEFVKVLDFGIVGLRSDAFDTRITGTGFIVGTPAYMSPEQARDPSNLTPAADFYSVGVLLFEMLTGRLPFDAGTPVDVLIQHSTEPPPPTPPSGGLEMLVSWMLEKMPDDRPQSAGELLAEVKRVMAEPPAPSKESSHYEETLEMILDDDEVARGEVLRALSMEAAPKEDVRQSVELPLLDPITYDSAPKTEVMPTPIPRRESTPAPQCASANEPINYEALRARLQRLEEGLTGAAEIESGIRATLSTRLEEMAAAVRPGLKAYRYHDLASKISELERDLYGSTTAP